MHFNNDSQGTIHMLGDTSSGGSKFWVKSAAVFDLRYLNWEGMLAQMCTTYSVKNLNFFSNNQPVIGQLSLRR